ncbi:hypothetical protein [Methylobacterium sp. AMS5]|uniref:phage tail fiber protein n=1 Tax=Methylobacterium sp. AMS5 TaxID=925818 RepID=UPI00074FA104|nr:hypothetical protein [Methylobacterium sp. AMS5]AMB48246.1 hypothetical protein Y590_25090 [Methylobacterium sp. AMS5]
MPGKSTFLENAILNYIKGTAFPAAPAKVYVGLFNGDPTDSGAGGTEVTTTVRAAGRVEAAFGAVANRTISNTNIVDFGNSGGTTNITHFALFSAQAGGNLLYTAPLTGGTQTINTTNPVSFPVGSVSVTED